MSYYFFIGQIMLPIPPQKVITRVNGKNKTINLINGGEANILKDNGLTDVSFSFLLPNNLYPFANYDNSLQTGFVDYAIGEINRRVGGVLGNAFTFKPAETFLAQINKAKKTKSPTRFIVTRMDGNYKTLFNTNMLVSIENYEIEESADNGKDLMVNIRLKQYKPVGTREVEVIKGEGGKELLNIKKRRYTPNKDYPNAVKITNENSLLELAQNLSDGRLKWQELAIKNAITNPLTTKLKGKVIKIG